MQQLITQYTTREPYKRKRAPEGTGHLDCVLPIELIVHILYFVPEHELVYWRHVSRAFRDEVDRVCLTHRTHNPKYPLGSELRISWTAAMESHARICEVFSASSPWGRVGFCDIERRAIDYAAFRCDIDALDFLAERFIHDDNVRLTIQAAEQGDDDLLEWLEETGRLAFDHGGRHIASISYEGWVIQWFWEKGMPLSYVPTRRGSCGDEEEPIKWAKTYPASKIKFYTVQDMQTATIFKLAVQRGSLEVVKTMLADKAAILPEKSIRWAARSGSVSMVKYVLENSPWLGEVSRLKIRESACKYGHLALLEWWWGKKMWRHYTDASPYNHDEAPSDFSFYQTVHAGRFDVIKWYARVYPRKMRQGRVGSCMRAAAKCGRVDILDWCERKFSSRFTFPVREILYEALTHDKADVLAWVTCSLLCVGGGYESGYFWQDNDPEFAAQTCGLSVLQWLYANVEFKNESWVSACHIIGRLTRIKAGTSSLRDKALVIKAWLISARVPGTRPDRACKRRKIARLQYV